MKLKNKSNENGITLIALIITIIILIILAAVSLRAVFFDGMIEVATDGVGNYATEQKKEENVFNDADHYIKVATNKKPEFKYIEVTGMTVTTAGIKAAAIDGDGENLTYRLFYGLDKDNLEEKDKKENIEQATEVQFEITGIDTTKLYYYRIDVSDKYATVQSQVSILTNKKPEIKKAEIIDVTKITAKAVVQGTDEDTVDKLTYKVYYGADKDTLETTGKVVEKGNITSGTEETLEIKELTPGTKYYYKIAITDGKQTVYTEVKEFTTEANNKPVITNVKVNAKTTSSITIAATATDADGEKLKYSLYVGTTNNNLAFVSQTGETNQNTQVTIPKSGLRNVY